MCVERWQGDTVTMAGSVVLHAELSLEDQSSQDTMSHTAVSRIMTVSSHTGEFIFGLPYCVLSIMKMSAEREKTVSHVVTTLV